MQRVKDGATASCGLLFERHHGRVYGYFVNATRNRGLSEDLVQEVFMRIIRYAHTYQAGQRFKPWLFRIARNVLFDHDRKRRLQTVDTDAVDLVINDPDPVEQEQEREMLRQAVRSLSDNYREIVELCLFADLSYTEVAESLGISENNARVRFFRAITSLRKHLAKDNKKDEL